MKQQMILTMTNNKLRGYCFHNQDATSEQLLTYRKSFEDAEIQAQKMGKESTDLADVNLTKKCWKRR